MNAKAMPIRQAVPSRVKSLAKFLLSILVLAGLLPPAPSQAQNASQLVGGTINSFAGSRDPNASQAYDGVPANSSQRPQNDTQSELKTFAGTVTLSNGKYVLEEDDAKTAKKFDEKRVVVREH